MKEVHEWCKNKVEKINALVENFYNQRPDREQRPPKLDANRLILLDGRIASDLSTLRYVTRKRKNVLKELAGIVGNERTPDNAFFGPAPHLSLGDPAGMASAAGLFADLGSALITVFKGARAEMKLVNSLNQNTQAREEYKQKILRNYGELVLLLRHVIRRGAENERVANIFWKEGLNTLILENCWTTVINNQWLVLAG